MTTLRYSPSPRPDRSAPPVLTSVWREIAEAIANGEARIDGLKARFAGENLSRKAVKSIVGYMVRLGLLDRTAGLYSLTETGRAQLSPTRSECALFKHGG